MRTAFSHAKGVMTDSRVCSYGTANMDIRSFELNFEVNAVIYDEETTKELENIFLEDLKLCKEITREDMRREICGFGEGAVQQTLSPLLSRVREETAFLCAGVKRRTECSLLLLCGRPVMKTGA